MHGTMKCHSCEHLMFYFSNVSILASLYKFKFCFLFVGDAPTMAENNGRIPTMLVGNDNDEDEMIYSSDVDDDEPFHRWCDY